MTKTYFKNASILAITPCARGIGFAFLEGHSKLLDWGVKSGKGDKNTVGIANAKELITRKKPEVIILQDITNAKRHPRIKMLNKKIAALAKTKKIEVALVSDDQIKVNFFDKAKGNRHNVAVAVAKRFSDELGLSLPSKRKLWKSEDRRIDYFYAVALALTLKLKR